MYLSNCSYLGFFGQNSKFCLVLHIPRINKKCCVFFQIVSIFTWTLVPKAPRWEIVSHLKCDLITSWKYKSAIFSLKDFLLHHRSCRYLFIFIHIYLWNNSYSQNIFLNSLKIKILNLMLKLSFIWPLMFFIKLKFCF